MSVSYSNIQPQRQTNKGLAVASLILGIISIPTLGLLGVGAITALALGSVALKRIKKDPETHGGKGMAIAGIITSAFSLLLTAVFCIVTAIAVPKFYEKVRHARESVALNSLRAIHNNEMQFNAMNSRYATLKELGEAGFLDQKYADGIVVSGYVYSSSSVSEKTYCIHAVRTDPAVASRDFVICEEGLIRFVESKTPGVVNRGEGAALDSSFYSR
jgi:type II secretory pathway pseudopilin PulG